MNDKNEVPRAADGPAYITTEGRVPDRDPRASAPTECITCRGSGEYKRGGVAMRCRCIAGRKLKAGT